ncbi:MAG: hypothetical protein IPJ65_30590 [Archangiaceae bacterium]|nr:hypothetical protein [Archangiaceae bacterium]
MTKRVAEQLLQSVEHELADVKVYEAALDSVIDEQLEELWEHYYAASATRLLQLTRLCRAMGVDVETETPGRKMVREAGRVLTDAMKASRLSGDLNGAQRVASECVSLARSRDHLQLLQLGPDSEPSAASAYASVSAIASHESAKA